MNVIRVERKSAVLTPSRLACLADTPTVNLTAGCSHRCVYCYTRGYSTFPGEDSILLYTNTCELLEREIRSRKRRSHSGRIPKSVYFSPSSDLFQPVPEVQEMALRVLETLYSHGIGVAFLTKGEISEEFFHVFEKYPSLTQAGIGLISMDDAVLSTMEPGAADARTRIENMRRLTAIGIPVRVRIDPIIPGMTDDHETIEKICENIASSGVSEIAVSVLFLRPAIAGFLRKSLSGTPFYDIISAEFSEAELLGINAGTHSRIQTLSQERRSEIYARMIKIASNHEIRTRICTCKNMDIPMNDSCNIAGVWPENDLYTLF